MSGKSESFVSTRRRTKNIESKREGVKKEMGNKDLQAKRNYTNESRYFASYFIVRNYWRFFYFGLSV